MTELENTGIPDDDLQGHNCGLINEKFNDNPIEPQPKEGEPEADMAKPPSEELSPENLARLKNRSTG